MRIVILEHRAGLCDYALELCRGWGLRAIALAPLKSLPTLDPADAPVAILPNGADSDADADEAVARAAIAYVQRGGSLITMLPGPALRREAGLDDLGEKPGPARLRVTGMRVAGLTGDLLPIVGPVRDYAPTSNAEKSAQPPRPLGYLSPPGQYKGETPGIFERAVGRGRIIALAFDLPLSVLLLRQGDPALQERIPPEDGCSRPSHLPPDMGLREAGWVPFADLLARLLVDLALRCLPAPAPLLAHVPGDSPGLLLFSGDEDFAPVAQSDAELDEVAAAGGRMNLYIIPNDTPSTRADIDRYRAHHDVGPHPNIRPLDKKPVAERLAEFERQIHLYAELAGEMPMSLRNHCTAWAGYLEMIEIEERLGVRMDANYFVAAAYLRSRDLQPYAGFGSAMPVRFCRPDGRMLDVLQQPTHPSDDTHFHPTVEYSAKLVPEAWAAMLARVLDDIARHWHTPYGVNFHPGGWALFSADAGRETLRVAKRKGFPVWSYDQWCRFWLARDGWSVERLNWDGRELQLVAAGPPAPEGLRFWLPATWRGQRLEAMSVDGAAAPSQAIERHGEEVVSAAIPPGRGRVMITARYGTAKERR
ncbi:MAG: hypothetical protein NTW19_21025 [Planctomycetota bacterium]|nr:hypothetical protein [Planctomycetota bacterium]